MVLSLVQRFPSRQSCSVADMPHDILENDPRGGEVPLMKQNWSPLAPVCGGRGIRTPGASRHDGFQDRCNRPLYHPSKEVKSGRWHLCGCKGRQNNEKWEKKDEKV